MRFCILLTLASMVAITNGCLDSRQYARYCSAYKRGGYCTNQYKNFMAQHCKRTCGLCRVRKVTCTDTSSQRRFCKAWKKRGYCRSGQYWYGYMSSQCKRTCGLCRRGKVMKRTTKTKTITTVSATTSTRSTKTGTTADVNCGADKKSLLGTIVDGTRATPNTWVWQAAIYWWGNFVCGGSLITREHILTAAHCVRYRDSERMIVRLGDHARDIKEGSEQEIGVDNITYHEQYDVVSLNNDIAILKLKKPSTLNINVGVVCLPEETKVVKPGEQCFITGWGRTAAGGTEANILQEAKMPVVSNADCAEKNKNSDGQSLVTENMLCAGHKIDSEISGCQGDSGGPFVCKTKDNKWVLQGIVSWGSALCDAETFYTVFARVTKYLNWIKNNL